MVAKIAAVVLAAAQMAACATRGPSLAELDARRERNVAGSTVSYDGVPAEQLRAASFEVLKLLNPNDMHFDVRSDRLLAAQTWRFTLILAASAGERWYEVKFMPEADAIRVSFVADEKGEVGNFIPSLKQPTFRENISIGSDEHLWVNAKLFFARLDYMLGRADKWPTCSEFQKKYGTLPLYFCGGLTGSIGIEDRAPTGRVIAAQD